MSRPRPVPWPTSLVVKNGSKMRRCSSGGMPEPGVADLDQHAIAVAGRADRQGPFAAHGVDGVVDDVGPHLVQLAAPGADLGEGAVVVTDDRHALLELVGQDHQRALEAVVDVDLARTAPCPGGCSPSWPRRARRCVRPSCGSRRRGSRCRGRATASGWRRARSAPAHAMHPFEPGVIEAGRGEDGGHAPRGPPRRRPGGGRPGRPLDRRPPTSTGCGARAGLVNGLGEQVEQLGELVVAQAGRQVDHDPASLLESSR